ncbi:MAG: class I SAM-dependent methyltransferase [Desulfobulbaceae bacterium]|nr:class I SAM-dependent methyltransferase [Desulfobulbaceae bacterium]
MTAATEIAIAPESREEAAAAAALAHHLQLPLLAPGDESFPLLLVVTARRLELRQTGPAAPGPVYVDFLEGKADFRRRYGRSGDEGVVQAVASKRSRTPTVLDATGGLGRDAFVLATHGCRVTLVERQPVIAHLLTDALQRAGADARIGPVIRERMALRIGDSREIMRNLAEAARPEVVYLDPMYPHRAKSALVKKEMVVLRLLAGPDQDSAELLAAARACATRRVVVKRPTGAPTLAGLPPELVQNIGNHRFDIYLTSSNRPDPKGR